jgi:RNA recognition motif-containing protein
VGDLQSLKLASSITVSIIRENILKFVRRYGTPVSFRFNFRAGTDVMEPRGYCFVEYSTREEAEKAKAALDGKKALGKKIVVDWARIDPATKKNASHNFPFCTRVCILALAQLWTMFSVSWNRYTCIQEDSVSETWDPSVVSETIDKGVR